MEYGAKHIPIRLVKGNEFTIDVIESNDVGNSVQLVLISCAIVKMNVLQCTKQKMIIYMKNQDVLALVNTQKK